LFLGLLLQDTLIDAVERRPQTKTANRKWGVDIYRTQLQVNFKLVMAQSALASSYSIKTYFQAS